MKFLWAIVAVIAAFYFIRKKGGAGTLASSNFSAGDPTQRFLANPTGTTLPPSSYQFNTYFDTQNRANIASTARTTNGVPDSANYVAPFSFTKLTGSGGVFSGLQGFKLPALPKPPGVFRTPWQQPITRNYLATKISVRS
jgi:hypothetical protein